VSEIKERAKAAANKTALYGYDNLADFKKDALVRDYTPEMFGLSEEEKNNLVEAGIVTSRGERLCSYLLMDHSPVHCSVSQDGVELVSMDDALGRYDGLESYWWKEVDVGTDKYTATAETYFNNGYFTRVKAGVKATFPVQACLYVGEEGIAQNVHNVIIVEEGAELQLITRCTTAPDVERGLHIGVSEIYVKKGGNAYLYYDT
jgi:hypothetical protein